MDLFDAPTEAAFRRYIDDLTEVLGHADRAGPFRDYCTGLLCPLERKSVEPMAAATAPSRTSAQHQSLLHFVGQSLWSSTALLSKVRSLVLPSIERDGPLRALIVDDTGIPKKGAHSVGVARQYCGQLGKQENAQVSVTLSLAGDGASLPIAHRLYLPKTWADDRTRRAKAGVPEEIEFQTKPEISLEHLAAALGDGVCPYPVLADAGYGNHTAFRDGVRALGLDYGVGILSSTSIWPPQTGPSAPKLWSGRGRPPSNLRHREGQKPLSVKAFAKSLPARAWRAIKWREGTNAPLRSRFTAQRIRPAHRDTQRKTPHPVEWLLIEWPKGEAEPTRYWLSTLPEKTAIAELVDLAKLRWRIERDYQDLKQEFGLGDFEGRGWRGFHHHGALCIAAYGFIISQRDAISPSKKNRAHARQKPALPQNKQPRQSAAANRTPHAKLHRNHKTTDRYRTRTVSAKMPCLQKSTPKITRFMTQ